MSTETVTHPFLILGEPTAGGVSDRRADVELKMGQVATLLAETGCEGLLLLDPDNFSWLTSGAIPRGQLNPDEAPAVYCNGEQRWLLASNVDSQRFFDEELDGLGFQLKEWPWHWGREQLLLDLCHSKRLVCDQPFGDAKVATDRLRRLRRQLSVYEQACLRALGHILSHALEATCRTMEPNQTEREVAGQISHRLMHRGVLPLHIGVAAGDRSKRYRNYGFTHIRRSPTTPR